MCDVIHKKKNQVQSRQHVLLLNLIWLIWIALINNVVFSAYLLLKGCGGQVTEWSRACLYPLLYLSLPFNRSLVERCRKSHVHPNPQILICPSNSVCIMPNTFCVNIYYLLTLIQYLTAHIKAKQARLIRSNICSIRCQGLSDGCRQYYNI